ncbi:MAG: hypothetical protein WA959_00325 [Rivularia sp. (in: cyanobacteria)]
MKLSEAIHNGLTNLGNSIDRATDKQLAWKRENREIGLLPDGEKLRLLKYELYRDVRAGKDTQELRKTIALLSNEVDRDRSYENSFVGLLNQIISLWLLIGVSTIAVSFLVTGLGCPNQSKFCADTKNVSNTITRYFTGE